MPTLLRLAIAAIATVVLFSGAAVLALADPSRAVLFGGSVSLALLTVPALLAGSFVSYWSWDEGARRRLRVWLGVLGGVQLVALIGFIGVLVALPAAALGGTIVLIAAVATDPIAVLLGRAARRRELRSPVPEDPDAILAAVRRGWRRAGFGAAIGLVIGLVGVTALTALFDDGNFTLRLLVFTPVPAALGASVGILTVPFRVAGRVRDLLGGDFSTARRINRAIAGKVDDLTEEESLRAARYAAIAPSWVGLQQASQLLNGVVSLTVIVNLIWNDPRLMWAAFALGGLMTLTIVTTCILFGVQRRRLRRFAAAHPVAATSA